MEPTDSNPPNDNETNDEEKITIDPDNIYIYKLSSGETILGFLRVDLLKKTNGRSLPLEQPFNVLSNIQPNGSGQISYNIAGAVPYNIAGDNSLVFINRAHVVSESRSNQGARELFFNLIELNNNKRPERENTKPELVWENPKHPLINNKQIDKSYLNIVEVDEDDPIVN